MTATTAILMIDMQKNYFEQDKRDVFGWPPIWRLGEVIEECSHLLATGRAAGRVRETTVARIVSSDRRLLRRFKGGVHWVTFGRDMRKESRPRWSMT